MQFFLLIFVVRMVFYLLINRLLYHNLIFSPRLIQVPHMTRITTNKHIKVYHSLSVISIFWLAGQRSDQPPIWFFYERENNYISVILTFLQTTWALPLWWNEHQYKLWWVVVYFNVANREKAWRGNSLLMRGCCWHRNWCQMQKGSSIRCYKIVVKM